MDKQLYVLHRRIRRFRCAADPVHQRAASGCQRLRNGMYEIMHDLFHMPKVMRQLAVVQFFSWFVRHVDLWHSRGHELSLWHDRRHLRHLQQWC